MSAIKVNAQFLNCGLLWMLLTLSLTVPCLASSKFDQNYQPIEIEIISDNGKTFSIHPVAQRYLKKENRAYVEAINGENYSLNIRNHSNQRLGLVIAVDGRNIISGQKSKLKHNENMYILGPYETQSYAGWRTSSRDIHRFYFTDIEDSYAHAFDDDSAMGVIAVAVYEEKQPFFTRHEKKQTINKPQASKPRAQAPNRSYDAAGESSGTANGSVLAEQAEKEVGTGFGKHQTSHVRKVHFNAKHTALVKNFYKYEWRETLCQKNIIDCGYHRHEKKNRFWPRDDYEVGYAPHPPTHHR
ncbi:MAG: hypothetical protein KJO81_09400 [Gammaproteobacteria bacterium]|nr:hypothetical protein [Gammaproteobacteria bacterium]